MPKRHHRVCCVVGTCVQVSVPAHRVVALRQALALACACCVAVLCVPPSCATCCQRVWLTSCDRLTLSDQNNNMLQHAVLVPTLVLIHVPAAPETQPVSLIFNGRTRWRLRCRKPQCGLRLKSSSACRLQLLQCAWEGGHRGSVCWLHASKHSIQQASRCHGDSISQRSKQLSNHIIAQQEPGWVGQPHRTWHASLQAPSQHVNISPVVRPPKVFYCCC